VSTALLPGAGRYGQYSFQYLLKELLVYRHFRHLEDYLSGVANPLASDLVRRLFHTKQARVMVAIATSGVKRQIKIIQTLQVGVE